MEYSFFINLLTNLREINLPGRVAHSLLAPPQRMSQLRSIQNTSIKLKKAAVLLLLYPNAEGKVSFVLTRRKVYKGVHSGQISFPGGKPEPSDDDLWATALRETHEEVGVSSDQVKYLRLLTELYVPPSDFLIIPFVGYSEETCVFKPDPTEVDAILEIPLQGLISKKPMMKKQDTSSCGSVKVPTYVFDHHQVWGATAMILSEFQMLLTAQRSK
ncbi:MAG: CoA pyrophosphatase [Flavobacteriaceae bacterium]